MLYEYQYKIYCTIHGSTPSRTENEITNGVNKMAADGWEPIQMAGHGEAKEM